MDKRKKKAWFKEVDRQEEQNQEAPEREKVRAHLVTRPKIGETWREKVDRDQKRPHRETQGLQQRGSARGESTRGQAKTRTRKVPQLKKRRIG